jgi:hypothetical protein
VNAALTKVWFFAKPFSFVVLGPNNFLFKFSEKEHISKILSQVWNVNGCLLALQTWSPKATLGELSLNIVPFWIQVHGLPLHNMSLKNSIAIGKGLGNFVKTDSANGVDCIFRSFLRLLVDIDVSKPLNPGFLFTIMDNFTTWISLKYERLDLYCTNCGLISHKKNSCLAPQANRFPTRYKISLHVNLFSNLNSPTYKHLQEENMFTPSSSPRITPTQPCMASSPPPPPPMQNLQYALSSSNQPLTPQNPSLMSYTPKSIISLTQDTHPQNIQNQTPLIATRLDTPLEYTLNAISLFQKPVQLLLENQLSSTSKLAHNSPSESNYEDPTHII